MIIRVSGFSRYSFLLLYVLLNMKWYLLLFLMVWMGGINAQEILRKPYLQYEVVSEEGVDIMVRWRADVSHLTLKYGQVLDSLERVGEDQLDVIEKPDSTWDYIACLEGLKVSGEKKELYYYVIVDEKDELVFPELGDTCFFKTKTNEKEDQELNIWVLGDSGKGGNPKTSKAAAVRKAFFDEKGYLEAEEMEAKDLDFMIMLGDNAYQRGRDFEMQAGIFDMYEKQLYHLPLYPALGNHETDYFNKEVGREDAFVRFYFEAFSLPSNGVTDEETDVHRAVPGAYYSYQYGNAHFVCLDSNFMNGMHVKPGPGSRKNIEQYVEDMKNWLIADLEKHAPHYKWLIVYWHNPIYTLPFGHHSHDDTESPVMRNVFVPILEKYDVDLVMSGHNHFYQRTHLIHGIYEQDSLYATLADQPIADSCFIQKGKPIESPEEFDVMDKRNTDGKGTVFVICGKSGGKTIGEGGCHQSLVALDEDCTFKEKTEIGSCHLQVTDEEIRVRFITPLFVEGVREDGYVVKDAFKILK